MRALYRTIRFLSICVAASGLLFVNPKPVVPAKRAPHIWFEVQNATTNCFPKKLVSLLHKVSSHFDKPVVVHSGFRSRYYNRRIGGKKESMHIQCKAADFYVPGVSGRKLYNFVRNLPERGGAGYYCGNSIHVDIGRKRCWGPCGDCGRELRIQKRLRRELASKLRSRLTKIEKRRDGRFQL